MPGLSPERDRGAVLVVDDNEDLRVTLADVLELEGWRVAQAKDGLDALDVLRDRGLPDLILLDLVMPRMDGREFLKEVRGNAASAHVPVIVITGTVPQDPLAADAVLQKPLEVEPFLRLVGRIAGRPRP